MMYPMTISALQAQLDEVEMLEDVQREERAIRAANVDAELFVQSSGIMIFHVALERPGRPRLESAVV